MFEGDDDDTLKGKMDRARRDPTRSPNEKYELKKQMKTKEKQKLVKLQSSFARKQLIDQQKKTKEEDNKKGIVTINVKEDDKKFEQDTKQQAAAAKEKGQTESASQTV